MSPLQRLVLTVVGLWLLLILVGCSSSPTAPTPPPIVNVPISPPVVSVPPPVIVAPPVVAFPPTDPRFDLTFYRQFVHNALEATNAKLEPLRRQTMPPRIYLRSVDNAGAPIDAFTLNQTASALESTAGSLTGVFGLAGLERGTETRRGQVGWITVEWSEFVDPLACGRAAVGGDLITLYPKSPCRCSGGPAVSLSTVKHELGHALGFWHTDSRLDLMYFLFESCDANPSAREIYHASVAYSRPIGSVAP